MAIHLMSFRLESVSDLLMHNPASMRRDDMGSDAPRRGSKRIPNPLDEAIAGLYVMPNSDQLYIASDVIREAAKIASVGFRDEARKGKATWKTPFNSGVFLTDEFCPLFRKNPRGELVTPITNRPPVGVGDIGDGDWEIYLKRVVVQGQGVIRSRARITNWACIVQFEVDVEMLPVGNNVAQAQRVLTAIINQAGKHPGLLDYRPGKGGPFGRYTATAVAMAAQALDQAA